MYFNFLIDKKKLSSQAWVCCKQQTPILLWITGETSTGFQKFSKPQLCIWTIAVLMHIMIIRFFETNKCRSILNKTLTLIYKIWTSFTKIHLLIKKYCHRPLWCVKNCYITYIVYYMTVSSGDHDMISVPRWQESPEVLCRPLPSISGDMTPRGFPFTSAKILRIHGIYV